MKMIVVVDNCLELLAAVNRPGALVVASGEMVEQVGLFLKLIYNEQIESGEEPFQIWEKLEEVEVGK